MAGKKNQGEHKRISGQRNPRDTLAKQFWSDNERFDALFNQGVFHKDLVNPESLMEVDSNNACKIEVKYGGKVYLQQTQDIMKQIKENNVTLVIFGLEDVADINYLQAYISWNYQFLNVARQVNELKKIHFRERCDEKERREKGGTSIDEEKKIKRRYHEICDGFYREDLLTPCVQAVIYTGQEKWDAKLNFEDLFVPNEYREYIGHFSYALIDVRHMSTEELRKYPREIQELFGFLKYENTPDLHDFVFDENLCFRNLMEETFEFLCEITNSPMLQEIKKQGKTSEGGIDVCYGIEIYAQKKAEEAVKKNTEQLNREKDLELKQQAHKKDLELKQQIHKKDLELKQQSLENERKIERTFVETAKMFGADMSDTIKKFAEKFGVSSRKAKKEVTMYWSAC